MNSYTLDNTKKDSNGLYDIFQKTVVENKQLGISTTTVEDGEEMRMDKICERLYGNTNLEEEIMVLNNILNQWTINVGDEIKYLVDDFGKMYEVDKTVSVDVTRTSLINPNKKTKKDPNRIDNLTPTVKPKNLKSLDVNTENNKIKIINKFE